MSQVTSHMSQVTSHMSQVTSCKSQLHLSIDKPTVYIFSHINRSHENVRFFWFLMKYSNHFKQFENSNNNNKILQYAVSGIEREDMILKDCIYSILSAVTCCRRDPLFVCIVRRLSCSQFL